LNRPSARDVFSKRSERYVNSATHADPDVLGRVVQFARVEAPSLALDIGTGTGHTAFALADAGASVVGFNITPEMIQQARRHIPTDSGDIRFVQGDAHTLPFSSSAFDIVTCRRTAHHFLDIPPTLAEMARVLRPGGRMVIDDRSVPEDDTVDAFVNNIDCIHDPSHVREYGVSAWRSMIEAAGLRLLDTQPYTQHRPIADYVKGIQDENADRLKDYVQQADKAILEKIQLKDNAYTHWFVTIAAERSA